MEEEGLGRGATGQAVKVLGVSARAQGGHDESLGFASLEDRGTMYPWKSARLTRYFPQVIGTAAIGPLATLEDVVTVDFFLKHLEGHGDVIEVVFFAQLFLDRCGCFFLDIGNGYFPILFGRSEDSIVQAISHDLAADVHYLVGSLDQFEIFLLLAAKLG